MPYIFFLGSCKINFKKIMILKLVPTDDNIHKETVFGRQGNFGQV